MKTHLIPLINELKDKGYSDEKIAVECGLSRMTITNWRNKGLLPLSYLARGRKSTSLETMGTIKALVEEGLSVQQITEKLKLSAPTILYYYPKLKSGHKRGKTAEEYLSHFDALSESKIAQLTGVSRQRIHQLEREFRVCGFVPRRRRHV